MEKFLQRQLENEFDAYCQERSFLQTETNEEVKTINSVPKLFYQSLYSSQRTSLIHHVLLLRTLNKHWKNLVDNVFFVKVLLVSKKLVDEAWKQYLLYLEQCKIEHQQITYNEKRFTNELKRIISCHKQQVWTLSIIRNSPILKYLFPNGNHPESLAPLLNHLISNTQWTQYTEFESFVSLSYLLEIKSTFSVPVVSPLHMDENRNWVRFHFELSRESVQDFDSGNVTVKNTRILLVASYCDLLSPRLMRRKVLLCNRNALESIKGSNSHQPDILYLNNDAFLSIQQAINLPAYFDHKIFIKMAFAILRVPISVFDLDNDSNIELMEDFVIKPSMFHREDPIATYLMEQQQISPPIQQILSKFTENIRQSALHIFQESNADIKRFPPLSNEHLDQEHIDQIFYWLDNVHHDINRHFCDFQHKHGNLISLLPSRLQYLMPIANYYESYGGTRLTTERSEDHFFTIRSIFCFLIPTSIIPSKENCHLEYQKVVLDGKTVNEFFGSASLVNVLTTSASIAEELKIPVLEASPLVKTAITLDSDYHVFNLDLLERLTCLLFRLIPNSGKPTRANQIDMIEFFFYFGYLYTSADFVEENNLRARVAKCWELIGIRDLFKNLS